MRADLAAELHRDLLNSGVPIAADLYSIYKQDEFIDINLIVLAPPGYGVSVRTRARDDGGWRHCRIGGAGKRTQAPR